MKRPGLNRIDAASAFIANARKAVLAEHTQVLRDGGLRDPELALDDDDDISGRELTAGQQLENTATDGITEDD